MFLLDLMSETHLYKNNHDHTFLLNEFMKLF